MDGPTESVTMPFARDIEGVAEEPRKIDGRNELTRAVVRLRKHGYGNEEMLAIVAASGDKSYACPIRGWPNGSSARRANEPLERLLSEGWYDFTTDDPDQKVWQVTDTEAEACADHAGLPPSLRRRNARRGRLVPGRA